MNLVSPVYDSYPGLPCPDGNGSAAGALRLVGLQDSDPAVLSSTDLEAGPRLPGSADPAPEESWEDSPAGRFLAETPSLLPLAEKLTLAARHDVIVLFTGETGTGKTRLARLLHDLSPRAAERFLVVSCGAIARNLIESELFGQVSGACHGADQDKPGKFAAAGAGTLLLEEVNALDLEQQAKLLRVADSGEYEPVGSSQPYRSACRLLVTCNCRLEQEVERGRFRTDLYYRLNGVAIHLPPLRERIGDIAPLARTLVARLGLRFDKPLADISRDALAALEAYPWPGNIRELENALLHAVVLSRGPVLQRRHLPAIVQNPPASGLDATERRAVHNALARHGYNRTQAALAMGISRVTLYKKLRKYGLLGESAK